MNGEIKTGSEILSALHQLATKRQRFLALARLECRGRIFYLTVIGCLLLLNHTRPDLWRAGIVFYVA
ncbi:hypothetical protein D3C87_1959020 [compost metagenome]